MKILQYHLIDKSFLTLDAELPFDVYELNSDQKTVRLLLPKSKTLTKIDMAFVKKASALYVKKEVVEVYEEYALSHLENLSKELPITYSAKAKVILDKAEHIMHSLFNDPETLGNVTLIEGIVNDLVVTILDEEFSIVTLMQLAEHDYYTHTHSINVAIYAVSLGKYLNLSVHDLKTLGEAALMHDLGKSKVRADIINKNGKLTSYEFEHMKHHPEWSYEIAQDMGITDQKILHAIRHHHEKLDGSGYPDHVKSKQISLFARIICVCDIFDALTTKRSYKNPVSTFETLKMMKEQMAEHIDIRILNSFIMMMHT